MQNFSQLRVLLAQREKELALLRSRFKHVETAELRHKETLGQLVKREHRLQILHEHSQEIVFICNERLVCRYVSPSITRWLGFLPREVVGLSLAQLFFPDDLAQVQAAFDKVLQSAGPNESLGQFRLTHKNKQSSYFEANATNLLLDPAVGGILITCQDISVRKRAQDQQQFLIHFGEKLLPLLDESTVIENATSEIGRYLEAARCYFAEINQDANKIIIHSNYCREGNTAKLESLEGIFHLDRPEIQRLLEELEAGKAIAIEDLQSHRLTAAFYQSDYEPLQIQSMLILPYLRGNIFLVVQETDSPRSWAEDEVALLQAVLERTWLAIHNARLYQRAEVAGVLEERARIAHELHDSLQQDFYGIILATHSAIKMLPAETTSPLMHQMHETLQVAEGGMMGLRSLIFDLQPEAVRKEGLVAGLNNYINILRTRYRLTVESALGQEPLISLVVKEALYRIGREAMFNTVKHTKATLIKVSLNWNEAQEFIELIVQDNGGGFDTTETFAGHYGLQTMLERTQALGGNINIESKPETGTHIRVRFQTFL